jgi:N6-L-threonylcarbamoyladenine synthase
MANRPDCDFSYSGLKTSVRVAMMNLRRERGLTDDTEELRQEDKANIAASFQDVAIRHLEQRLRRCMKMLDGSNIRSLAVVGGVAANAELRSRLHALCEKMRWRMFVPPPRLCTDQGAMSAWAAIERIMVGSTDDASNQEVFARFPFAELQGDEQNIGTITSDVS